MGWLAGNTSMRIQTGFWQIANLNLQIQEVQKVNTLTKANCPAENVQY